MLKQSPNNRKRAEWASRALKEYALNVSSLNDFELEPETTVSDLLADIRHFCDSKEIDFDDALAQAKRHYGAEMMGDD